MRERVCGLDGARASSCVCVRACVCVKGEAGVRVRARVWCW